MESRLQAVFGVMGHEAAGVIDRVGENVKEWLPGDRVTFDSAKTDVVTEVFHRTKGRGADVAVEAVGINATVDMAFRAVRKGGHVTLVGNVTPKVDLPLQVAVTRELTVSGSCASRGEYPACLEMMARGAVNIDPCLSAVAPLSDGAAWFDRLYRKEPGLLKVLLTP